MLFNWNRKNDVNYKIYPSVACWNEKNEKSKKKKKSDYRILVAVQKEYKKNAREISNYNTYDGLSWTLYVCRLQDIRDERFSTVFLCFFFFENDRYSQIIYRRLHRTQRIET